MTDFLIVTALQEELESILKRVKNPGPRKLIKDSGQVYYECNIGRQSNKKPNTIIASMTKSGRLEAAIWGIEALKTWQPKNVILTGICGGYKGAVKLGDIIIADRIYDFSDKVLGDDQNLSRPISYEVSSSLLSFAKSDVRKEWINRVDTKNFKSNIPKVHVGSVLSIDDTISNTNVFDEYREKVGRLIGVDMESAGLSEAIQHYGHQAQITIIKAVSDLLDRNKDDSWRINACETAASYTVFLIEEYLSIYDGIDSTNYHKSDKSDHDEEEEILEVGLGITLSRRFNREDACLKAVDYAEAISDVLRLAVGEVCFAIFGHWGRGKTYLMHLTEKALPDEYECIWFSAWKFRTKPELWAYLYESIRKKAVDDSIVKAIPRIFRGNISRFGLFPIFIGIWLLTIISIPFSIIVPFLLGVFGVLGIVKIVSLYTKTTPRVSAFAKKYLKFSEHHDKLGPQSILSEDFKALIKGWFGKLQYSKTTISLYLALYFVSIITFCTTIYVNFNKSSDLFVPLIGNIKLYPSQWFLISTIILLFVILAVAPFWLLFYGNEKIKALLIIDDLDRMPPDEMLEVVESLKLFLEDDEIHSLMQVVMIVEEDCLSDAILRKYMRAIAFNKFIHGNEKENESAIRIVEENIQKLFIAHLRLPPLDVDEQIEFINNALNYDLKVLNEKIGTDREETDSDPNNQDNNEIDSKIDFETSSTSQNHNNVTQSDITNTQELTENEKEALIFALKNLSSNMNSWANIGPRAINSFIFRYKLARRLLLARGSSIQPNKLANSISQAFIENKYRSLEHIPTKDKVLNAVIKEVI